MISKAFDTNAQLRGSEYFLAGRVTIREIGAARAVAIVRGNGGAYSTSFRHESRGTWVVECTCPLSLQRIRCKHLWALALAVDDLGWRLEGATRTSLDSAHLVRPGGWRVRLADLRAEAKELSPPTPQREERVVYVLRIDLCRFDAAIVVETRRSYLRKTGAWSKPVPFAAFSHSNDRNLSAHDRRIVGLLRSRHDPWLSARAKQFALEEDHAALLLPLIAEGGTLHWADLVRESPGPIVFDSGEPWHLQRTLRADPAKGDLVIEGHWSRGDLTRGLDETIAVLPGGFLVLPDRIGRVARHVEAVWARELEEHGPLRVPASDKDELLRELGQSGEDVEIDAALGLARRDVAPTPRLTLDAPVVANREALELTGVIAFDYEGTTVAPDDARRMIEHTGGWIVRAPQAEAAALRRPLALGARARPQPAGGVVAPLERIAELARTLTGEGWIVEGEGARYRQAGAAKWSLKSGVDWFELDGQVDFGGASAALPRLIAALRRKERTLLLDDGSIGVVPEEWLARFGTLTALGQAKGDLVRFKSSQAWLLDALLAEQANVTVDKRFREQVARLKEFRNVEAVAEPSSFHGELRPYQREGLGWLEFLERQGLGGCLADDMGLGKTIQVLAWLLARRARRREHAPTLVVAPKSLTHNWIAEARRFAPTLSTLEYTGTTRRALVEQFARHDLVVTTYGTLRNDIERLGDEQFDCVVLDESQAIKNSGSLTAKAARLLQADHRLALSGTPIENHLGELWSLFEFLNPGMLGRSSVFGELLAAPRQQSLGDDSRELLAQAVRPFVLRRTKEQVLHDLPQKTEQTVTCDMEPRQRREYDELREHYRRVLLEGPSGDRPDSFRVLEALLRLRQAACHPGLIDASRAGETSAKLEALFEMLEDVLQSGHKALVFSQFTSFLAIVRKRIEQRGIVHAYLDGQTSAPARTEEIRRFQEDAACPLFLLSLKAGGVGLNLTAADYVFLLDPWWNPAVEAQAVGRAHRIGQTRSVFAYRFVCGDTIEERVLELQAKKRELAAVILEGEATSLRDLTRDDLERLLR